VRSRGDALDTARRPGDGTPGAVTNEVDAILRNIRAVRQEDAGSPTPGPANGASRFELQVVLSSLDDDQAQDAVVIDLTGKTTIADAMIVASGRSARHVGAMADHLVERLKAAGLTVQVEGQAHADWVLIDAGDVIVHLFRPEVREFYALEKMWGGDMPVAQPRGEAAAGLWHA